MSDPTDMTSRRLRQRIARGEQNETDRLLETLFPGCDFLGNRFVEIPPESDPTEDVHA